MTPEQTLDWLAEQHKSQCNEDRPVQEWIRSMKSMLPAPVQEPYKSMSEHIAQATSGRVCIDPITGDVGIGTPAAQPAPVQEPMAWVDVDENGTMYSLRYWSEPDNRNEVALYRAPPNVATPLPAPVQEPVAWVCYGAPGKRDIDFEEADIDGLPVGTLLYTTPPAAQPAPAQEPVAWWNGKHGSPVFAFERDTPGIGLGNPDAAPLYTTPPAQEFVCSTGLCHYKAQPAPKPLTDEQIKQIYTEQTGSFIDDSPWALLDFARAIEAAHGITEKGGAA